MADNPLISRELTQNPSPSPEVGQEFILRVSEQTERIMAWFLKVLPSNYVAQIKGPFYSLQFQAAAEQIANFQVLGQEVYKDSDYDYTRPEYLWEILGTLVFPDAVKRRDVPTVDGDTEYRTFLQNMVLLLLKGATPEAVEEGAGLLTDATVTVVEKFLGSRDVGSAWDLDDQFTFEVNVEQDGGTAFPDDPFTLQENVRIILRALKPAHTLYDYRHVFREAFGEIEAELSWSMGAYYYDDMRKFCQGAKAIVGAAGETMSTRTLFRDSTRSFNSVVMGAVLTITSGSNAGQHQVREVKTFPGGDDSTARAYTTAPTGLTGFASVTSGVLVDTSQNWGLAAKGEVLTFTVGSNAGSYLLADILGPTGGPVGVVAGPGTQVTVEPSVLRVQRRMNVAATGQGYSVDVDRLGVREPQTILDEDVAPQFLP